MSNMWQKLGMLIALPIYWSVWGSFTILMGAQIIRWWLPATIWDYASLMRTGAIGGALISIPAAILIRLVHSASGYKSMHPLAHLVVIVTAGGALGALGIRVTNVYDDHRLDTTMSNLWNVTLAGTLGSFMMLTPEAVWKMVKRKQ
jgi:hypothetical protein